MAAPRGVGEAARAGDVLALPGLRDRLLPDRGDVELAEVGLVDLGRGDLHGLVARVDVGLAVAARRAGAAPVGVARQLEAAVGAVGVRDLLEAVALLGVDHRAGVARRATRGRGPTPGRQIGGLGRLDHAVLRRGGGGRHAQQVHVRGQPRQGAGLLRGARAGDVPRGRARPRRGGARRGAREHVHERANSRAKTIKPAHRQISGKRTRPPPVLASHSTSPGSRASPGHGVAVG